MANNMQGQGYAPGAGFREGQRQASNDKSRAQAIRARNRGPGRDRNNTSPPVMTGPDRTSICLFELASAARTLRDCGGSRERELAVWWAYEMASPYVDVPPTDRDDWYLAVLDEWVQDITRTIRSRPRVNIEAMLYRRAAIDWAIEVITADRRRMEPA